MHHAEYALADFEREARTVTDRARQAAKNILATALAKIDEIRETARREGYDKGFQEGKRVAFAEEQAKLRQEAGKALGAIGALDKELARNRHLIAGQAKDDVIRLALAIAHRIIKTQVRCDPGVLRSNVEKALELISRRRGNVRIRVNPADLELMEKFLPDLRQTWEAGGQWELAADKTIAPGGCRVEAEQCAVDADIAVQLAEIEQLLSPSSGGSASGSVVGNTKS